MMKKDEHIEIVRSNKKELSSLSQRSCDAIYKLLAKRYRRVGVTTINELSDLDALAAKRPDLAFLGMEFVPAAPGDISDDSEKIWLADFLEENNIAYTGSAKIAHWVTRDKSYAKQRVHQAGLTTSTFTIIRKSTLPMQTDIHQNYPVFIKPSNKGGGVGIDSDSVAHNFSQLSAKTASISAGLQADSLIEEYLTGREYSVAILKDEHSDGYSAMPLELVAPADERGARMLSRNVKSLDREQAVAITDLRIKREVSALALNVFHALGARDYGRIDIRSDKNGTPHFLEANLIPSLIEGYGSFPKACAMQENIGYETMIMRIINLGLARKVDRIIEIIQPSLASRIIFPVFQPEQL